MNIILEGPDAVGKTTLAEKLKNKYNMNIIHSTSKTRNDLNYHIDLLDYQNNTVFDRFHIGELVYPEIYNRSSCLSLDDFNLINKRIIDNQDVLVVFYTSDLSILKDRLIKRGELNYLDEIEQQNKLFSFYASVLSQYDYKYFYIMDISEENSYDMLDNWIDSIYNKTNINICYRNLCRDILEKGHLVETKTGSRGRSLELNNYQFTIDDIDTDFISLKTAKSSLVYIVGEYLWYHSSRNDLDFISKFSKFWTNISDDGVTSNSAYGYILQEKYGFDQIETIINLLEEDPTSRRAVLNINVPNIDVATTKDELCTIALIYFIRDNKLHSTTIMRSNDILFGLRNDLPYFIRLQKYIADSLGVECGSYTHFATSIHLYEKDMQIAKDVAYGNMETINDKIDFNLLNYHSKYLINYIDNKWVNKEKFEEVLRRLFIINDR